MNNSYLFRLNLEHGNVHRSVPRMDLIKHFNVNILCFRNYDSRAKMKIDN